MYTCDGSNTPPPLTWGPVPADIGEVTVLAVALRRRTVEWAVAGLKPALHKLDGEHLPPGAFLLATSARRSGYSICPAKTESYAFVMLALPPRVRVGRGVTGPELLTDLLQGPTTYRTPAEGFFDVTYVRSR